MNTKKRALGLVVSVVALPIAGAASPSGLDGMIRCAALDDPGQRLACYDREIAPHVAARRSPAAPAPAPTPDPAVAPAVATAPAPQQAIPPPTAPAPAAPVVAQAPAAPPATQRTLGEEQLPVERRPAPQPSEVSQTAQISALGKAGSAHFVTLDNGQVWRHEDPAQGSYLKVGESVTITRAALGSYRLTRDAGQSKNWIRVSRVR